MSKNLTTIFLFIFLISISMVYAQSTLVVIGTCAAFSDIRNDPTDNYRIENDIDCTGTKNWNNGRGLLPMGNFSGTLDGQGFTIDGITMNLSGIGEGHVGLFNRSKGTIQNLIFTNVNISLDGTWGGVITGLNLGDISTIFISGNTWINGLDYYGGLVGRHQNGTIDKISLDLNTVDEFPIFGSGIVGGILGSIDNQQTSGTYPIIRECRIQGNMKVNGSIVGGVVGTAFNGIIEDCYGINDIIAGDQQTRAGAFIGENDGFISSSYHDGSLSVDIVSGNVPRVGCFVGSNLNAISWSYTTCDLIIPSGSTLHNGSFAGLNNQTLIKIFSWIDYFTPPTTDQYLCIGNESGTFNDCIFVSPESSFFNIDRDPMITWDFVDAWNSDTDDITHPTLQFEIDAGFDTVVEENNLIPCDFPKLFCDDFNYQGSLYSLKGWNVLNENGDLDQFFQPRQNKAVLNGTNPKTLQHYGFTNFPVNYTREDGFTIFKSIYAPSFSNELDFSINTSGSFSRLDFKSVDFEGDECVHIRVWNSTPMQLTYENPDTGTFTNITDINTDETYRLKITTYFNSENKTDIYGFNTSYSNTHFKIWLNGTSVNAKVLGEYTTEFDVFDSCDSIKSFLIVKEGGSLVSAFIDNYYMYVGTDKNINTIDDHIVDISPALTSQDVFGNQTGEVVVTISNMWETIGLSTPASKIIMAMTLLFFGTLGLIGGFLTAGHNPNVGIITFCDFMFMILLTYLGLLPVWVMISISSFGILGFVLWFKFAVLSDS